MKMRKYLTALVVLVSAAAVSKAQTAPRNVVVPGLKASVTVRRDARSIPYLEAKSDDDLYFAQGYVTASDRLWQMDLLRRVARGELAEIFGRQVLEEDKRWRRFGFAKIAEDSLATLNPDLKRALDNYARGVNAYLATLDKDTLPVEFKILQYRPREWRATDTIAIGKILADALSTTWQHDLIRASLQNLPKEKLAELTDQVTPYDVVLFGKDTARGIKSAVRRPPSAVGKQNMAGRMSELALAGREIELREASLSRIGLFAEELAASNNWVIAGSRTIDGKPLLANDPHLLPAAPGIWYLSHLATPSMRVAGVTFPGVPGIVLGHNDLIAWGATNVGPDVQDLYREEFDGAGRYKTPKGWESVVVRREEIKVRKNPLNPETETQTLEVEETRNGVVITDETGQKFALRWTARDPRNQEFEAFFLLNRAKDWADFRKALQTYGGAAQNFVYADTTGNIGWIAAGRIPIRRTGDGSVPYNGATGEGDWTGFIPFNELPQLYNPPSGLIVTANQRTVGTDYKHYSVMARDAAMPWRARRIYELLEANRRISMNDVRDAQMDVLNLPFSRLARDVAELGANASVKQTLQGWDGRTTADSKAALVVNEIRNCLVDKIAQDNKPTPAFLIRERVLYRAIRERALRWLPKGFASYNQLVQACETEALASLAKKYGADETKWRWGDSFVAVFQHPLSVAPLIGGQFALRFTNVSGSGQTPNVGPYVSMRLIASPGNWDETRHVIPLGQSGNPQSEHWKDQFEAWRTGSAAVFPFSREAVEKAAKQIWVLNVK